MAKAVWNGTVIAESGQTQRVDGYTYFPPTSVDRRYVRASDHRSVCSWKGTASYFDVVVGDRVNPEAAWVYPQPKEAARHLAGWIGFWKGVEIVA